MLFTDADEPVWWSVYDTEVEKYNSLIFLTLVATSCVLVGVREVAERAGVAGKWKPVHLRIFGE